jgi:AraC family transcriptional regulator
MESHWAEDLKISLSCKAESTMNRTIPSGRWHGNTIMVKELGGVRLAELVYPSGYKTRPHAHESSVYCLVQNGSYTQRFRSKISEAKPSTVTYLRSDDPHTDKFHDAGARCFVIELKQDWLTNSRKSQYLLRNSTTFQGGVPALCATRIYAEFRNTDELSGLAIEGLVIELIAQTSRTCLERDSFKGQRWLRRAEEFIHAHFSEQLSLREIAMNADVHPVHLARAFRKQHHCTVGAYIRALRVQFARQAIMTTGDPLTDIAMNAGFCDHSHFTRTFKKLTGQTPRECRKTSVDDVNSLRPARTPR